jgi:hypothetical protein
LKYDLKKPCKNCPFSIGKEAIKFYSRERAEEIEETAYRNGFPCHLSAELREHYVDGNMEEGYFEGDNTQHCAGAAIMFMRNYEGPWPGIYNDEEIYERLCERVDWDSDAYYSVDEFLEGSVEKR